MNQPLVQEQFLDVEEEESGTLFEAVERLLQEDASTRVVARVRVVAYDAVGHGDKQIGDVDACVAEGVLHVSVFDGPVVQG